MSRRVGVVIAAGGAAVILLVLIFSMTSEEQTVAIGSEAAPETHLIQTTGAQFDTEQPDDSELEVIELLARGLPVEGCEPPSPRDRKQPSEDEWRALTGSAGEKLMLTDDPDLLLAAALLNEDEKKRWKLVDRSLAVVAGNPVALWHQLQHCYQVGCERDAIEAAAIAADESNGMVWLEIASDRIRKGAWGEAESALRRAVDAPRFDMYFMDYATVVEHGLAATTDLDYTNRISMGIGISAALAIPDFGDVMQACKSGESDELVWISLCDELGEQMSETGRELITVMIGYGYRKAAATRAGDSGRADRLTAKSEQIVRNLSQRRAEAGTEALLTNDPALLQDYVEYFRAHGEAHAMQLLIEDAKRLRKEPTYDQCNFVGDPDYGL